MNDFFNSALSPDSGLFGVLVPAVLVAMFYFAFRHRINFWVMDTWYVLPWIGKIARLAKDCTQSSFGDWLNVERTLCADYKKYIHLIRGPVFDSRIEYLKKAYDLGRTPAPLWVMLFLVALVIAEGLGFSYMLGTWMAREGSANTHTVLMVAIVLVLCGIMVWVTHSAGHQYYRTSLLRGCFKRFHGKIKNKDKNNKDNNVFSGKSIALKDDQSGDDTEPDYSQCANRVSDGPGDEGSYGWVVVAAVAIATIAILSTYMRWENLKGELVRETALQTQQANAGNPFANGGLALPTEVTGPQQAADDKASGEAREATKGEGMAAFIMLAFIFVVTQIVGCSAGYKYGFAGKESKNAYKETLGFSTYDAYLAHYEPLRHLAESRLQVLQQRLEEYSHQELNLSKTFMHFLLEKTEEGVGWQQTMNKIDTVRQPQPAQQLEPAPNSKAQKVEEIMKRLDGLASKEEKIAVMRTLDAGLQAEMASAIKDRKAQEAALLEADLQALF